jgi:hypothetical protein
MSAATRTVIRRAGIEWSGDMTGIQRSTTMVRIASGGERGWLGGASPRWPRSPWLLLLALTLAAGPVGRAAATPAGLFLDNTNKVDSARIARDHAGGLHVAFAAYGPDTGGKEPAHYAFCAANCDSAANWAVVDIGDGSSHVSKVQLALTPDGHPRLLILGTDAGFMPQFQYAECDTGCTSAANWHLTTLVGITYVDPTVFDYPQHSFALDHLGRPRFIYYDDNGSIHRGSFYAFCDTGCTTKTNWFELLLSPDLFDSPSLTFTSSGQPRLATVIFGGLPQSGQLGYFECNTACEANALNWLGSFLAQRGSGHATWALRLDSQNRPRLAFFQGDLGGGQGNALGYLWCDTGCEDSAHWGVTTPTLTPGVNTDSADADLAFDGQDRPHLSYRTGSPDFGLAHAWCDANCQSSSGTWHGELLESANTLDTERPLPPDPPCTTTNWFGGFRSSLALDSGGNPLVAYDAEHIVNTGAGCVATNTDFKTIRVLVRGPLFADVPSGYWARTWIEGLYNTGVTGGCTTTPLQYCPSAPVTREQMAVFLLKASLGAGHTPPACATAPFPDVPCSSPYAAWIQELVARGITSGCGGGLYCPTNPVTREQMAVFLLKALAVTPGPCTTAPFSDVPCSSPFATWIQELVARGITAGCAAGLYCPTTQITRDQMAVFLVKAFNLPL